MLILFDIDLTLLSTAGAGMKSLVDAGRSLYGPSFHAEGVDFAGRLDPLIIDDLLRLNGQAVDATQRGAIKASYREHLARRLHEPGSARVLPGVLDLLGILRARSSQTLGLLTGNFEETGRMKLAAAGVDASVFALAAWGDQSPHDPPARAHLVPVAMDRYLELRGARVDPAKVTVIGDTPHDVACAHAYGCRSLAVATGRSSLEELRASGATLAIPDLSQTEAVLAWLEG